MSEQYSKKRVLRGLKLELSAKVELPTINSGAAPGMSTFGERDIDVVDGKRR